MTDNLVPITEAKARLPELARQAAEGTRSVLLRHGRPVAVVMGVDDLQGLLDQLDDLEDRISIYEARDADPAESITHEELMGQLGQVARSG